MKYAKEENHVLVYPTQDEFPGIPNWQTHDAKLRHKKYLPLEGEPEERDGYTAKPATWHVVESSTIRKEKRQKDPVTGEWFVEDVMKEDPETHEMVKVDERHVMKEVDIVVDTSYIQVDTWEYTPIPEPTPEPEPTVEYSKYKLKKACEKRGLWDDVKAAIEFQGKWESFLLIQTISSDNQELKDTLPVIRETFGSDVVDEVLAESIAD